MNVLVIDRVDGRVRGLVVLPDGTLEVEDADLRRRLEEALAELGEELLLPGSQLGKGLGGRPVLSRTLQAVGRTEPGWPTALCRYLRTRRTLGRYQFHLEPS